jgi:hypothetical protein
MTHEEEHRMMTHLKRIQPHINDAIDRLHRVLEIADVPLRVQQISFSPTARNAAGSLVPCKVDGQIILMPPPCP